jgi:hypothetical protein
MFSSLPASVPEPIAVALSAATIGMFICSPPAVSSMRLRMMAVRSVAHVGREQIVAHPFAVDFAGELDELVVGLGRGESHDGYPFGLMAVTAVRSIKKAARKRPVRICDGGVFSRWRI